MKSLSKESRILLYFFILLLILWLVFDSLKFSWTDDTFQKVILAPLGEEPFKLLLTIMSCLCIFAGPYLSQVSSKIDKKPKQKLSFISVFYKAYIPFSILIAILFGLSEGPLYNIVLHFSTTTIAAVLIITIFRKVKDKDWKLPWKVFAIFSTMSLPMFLHSLANQYANITYVINYPQFEYFIVIARFLKNNTFLNEVMYVQILFLITVIVLYIYIYYYTVIPWLLRKKKYKKS